VLLLAVAFAVLLKAYDPVFSPVIGAWDPWWWVVQARRFLATGQLDPWFINTGYPPTHMFMTAAIASLGIDAYDVIRYIPIISSLCVIPIYLLMLEIFESRRVAAITALLTVTARLHFMRTSIGIPESLSHIALTFTLYYLLRSLKTGSGIYRAIATISMTVTILYYHFTLVVLAPFLAMLFFLVRSKGENKDLKVLGGIVIPAMLFSGIVWYFRVAGSIIHTYLIETYYAYQPLPIQVSVSGLLYVLAYSVGKLGAIALSSLGYAMAILALLGFAGLLLLRKNRKATTMHVRFMDAYLISLTILAFVLGLLYNLTGMPGTGAGKLYVFSWLAMPVAAFASQAIERTSEALQNILVRWFMVACDRQILRAVPAAFTILICLMNLSAINYYKAWSGRGMGFLESHYYVKFMTDEEYRAFEYIRDNTPRNCTVLTVGVEELILNYQVTVSRRTMVSIRDLVEEGGVIIADVAVVYPDYNSKYCRSKITFIGEESNYVYFIIGIKTVSSEGESPASKNAVMEWILANRIASSGGYECVYRNSQVTVLRALSISIQHLV